MVPPRPPDRRPLPSASSINLGLHGDSILSQYVWVGFIVEEGFRF